MSIVLYSIFMGYAIDHDGPTSVYRQLADVLAGQIRSGAIEPNRPIPSEALLCREFGVARGTARKAVELLRDDGLVITVAGRGTFARPNAERMR